MSNYSRGIFTGMMVGAATGIYILVRSNPAIKRKYYMRTVNFRNRAMMFTSAISKATSMLGRAMKMGTAFVLSQAGQFNRKIKAMQ